MLLLLMRSCPIKIYRESFFVLIVLTIILCSWVDVVVGKCANDSTCMNGGVCINGTCVCPDGWQGDDCQFCGGKVRYVACDSNLFVFQSLEHESSCHWHSICYAFALKMFKCFSFK